MSVEMLTAIGGFFAGVAAIISAILLNRKTQALLEYRLGAVERELAETTKCMSEVKTDVAVIKTKMEYITKEANE